MAGKQERGSRGAGVLVRSAKRIITVRLHAHNHCWERRQGVKQVLFLDGEELDGAAFAAMVTGLLLGASVRASKTLDRACRRMQFMCAAALALAIHFGDTAAHLLGRGAEKV